MREFIKPKIVLSACLNLEPVRYNGQLVKDDFVLKSKSPSCGVSNTLIYIKIGKVKFTTLKEKDSLP